MSKLDSLAVAADRAKAQMLETNKPVYVYLSGDEYVVNDISPVFAPKGMILIGETRPRR
jgi:hypothetical protein